MADTGQKLSLLAIILAIITGFALWLWPAKVETMVIRQMEWSREVREYEYYQDYVCHPRTKARPDGSIEHYQDCEWETKTRITRRWPTAGVYPAEPYWETNYHIMAGRHESRVETYTIRFSDDKKLYPYWTHNYAEYQGFKPKQSHQVAVNIFGVVTQVRN